MTTKTRYQEWAEYHVYHWAEMLRRAEIAGDENWLAHCQRRLNYWQKRVKD